MCVCTDITSHSATFSHTRRHEKKLSDTRSEQTSTAGLIETTQARVSHAEPTVALTLLWKNYFITIIRNNLTAIL